MVLLLIEKQHMMNILNKEVNKMKNSLKDFAIIIGPYLYFLGFAFEFLDLVFVGTVFLLVGLICYVFARIYCIYYVAKNRKSYEDKWILHLILLLMFSPFYIPIFYIHFVLNKKLVWSILCAALYPIILILMVVLLIIKDFNINLDEYKTIITKDELVSVSVSNEYKCRTNAIGDASLICTGYDDKTYFELYNYQNEENYKDIFDSIYESKLLKYKSKNNVQVTNENKKELYATFTVIDGYLTYQMTIELKVLDDNVVTILVNYDYSYSNNYNEIFSSISLSSKLNTL